jgi:membrane protease YdiL (CAAX protease family)
MDEAAPLVRPRALRAFGPVGILWILAILSGNIVVVPMSAVLVLVWAKLSETPPRDIGYVWPRSWPRTIAIGVILGAALKLVMKAVVMPLLGADPVNRAYHYLAGNRAAVPFMLYAVIVGAGFGEETVFRGWMFERLHALLGRGRVATVAILVFTSAVFGAAHYSTQGVPGTEQAVVTGLVFGSIYAATGELPMLMIAHATFDLVALALIYWNLEPVVAHLLFR